MGSSRRQVTNNIWVDNGMVCIKRFKDLKDNKEDKVYIENLFNTALEKTCDEPLLSFSNQSAIRLKNKKEGDLIDGYIMASNEVQFYLSTDKSTRPYVSKEEGGVFYQQFVLTNNNLVLCAQQPAAVCQVKQEGQDEDKKPVGSPQKQKVLDQKPTELDSSPPPSLSWFKNLQYKFQKLPIRKRLLMVLGLGALFTAITFLTGGAIAAACGIGFVAYATFTGTTLAGTIPLTFTGGGSTMLIGTALDPDWTLRKPSWNGVISCILGESDEEEQVPQQRHREAEAQQVRTMLSEDLPSQQTMRHNKKGRF